MENVNGFQRMDRILRVARIQIVQSSVALLEVSFTSILHSGLLLSMTRRIFWRALRNLDHNLTLRSKDWSRVLK